MRSFNTAVTYKPGALNHRQMTQIVSILTIKYFLTLIYILHFFVLNQSLLCEEQLFIFTLFIRLFYKVIIIKHHYETCLVTWHLTRWYIVPYPSLLLLKLIISYLWVPGLPGYCISAFLKIKVENYKRGSEKYMPGIRNDIPPGEVPGN